MLGLVPMSGSAKVSYLILQFVRTSNNFDFKYPEFIKRKIRARLKGFKNHRNLAIRVPDGFQSADAEEYLNFTVKNKGINTLEIGALDRVIPFPGIFILIMTLFSESHKA